MTRRDLRRIWRNARLSDKPINATYTLYTRDATYAICTVCIMEYMWIIRSYRYGYEFTDKAIVENYNKSVGNTHRRALVIAS